MEKIVLYHAKCIDGFAAAWAAWRKFGDGAEYLACQYGSPPPDVTGKDVYIVDFSFSRETLLEMSKVAKRVVLLDHHVTAERDLVGLEAPNLEIHFDMGRSGARMTWDYFWGSEPCWLADYVQDRDLWKFELKDSQVINAFIQCLPHTFESYEQLFKDGLGVATLLGQGAYAWSRTYIEATKKLAVRGQFLGYEVPIVNAPYVGISEIVGELSEGHPFAVGWHVTESGSVYYSLRSRGDFDVSELAKSMGGGGHKKAAGFTKNLFPSDLKVPA